MKSLHQIEPRTAISSLPFTINNAGSYYLTQNLSGSGDAILITIAVDNVVLDLNGFELERGTGDNLGIFSSKRSIIIRNGTLRDCSITLENSAGLVETIATYSGEISVGDSSVVQSCVLDGRGINAGHGAVVKNCVVRNSNSDGIDAGNGAQISDCAAFGSTGQYGIRAHTASVITNCSAYGTNGLLTVAGISAAFGSSITNCTAGLNKGDGISVSNACRVVGNTSYGNGVNGSGAGISTTTGDSLIEKNHLVANDFGLRIAGPGNTIRDNFVQGNTGNYSIAAGNRVELLLSQLPETIAVPALVRLSGTLSGSTGITVSSDDVTIDLNGHSLLGPGSASGANSGVLLMGGRQSITIRNGSIRNWGSHGVDGADDDRISVRDLESSSNGGAGVYLRAVVLVEACRAFGNGAQGLRVADSARIVNCVVDSNGGDGIATGLGSQVSGSTSRLSGGDGIQVGNHSSVIECTVTEAGEDGAEGPDGTVGIQTGTVATVVDCSVRGASGDGINVAGGSLVSRCTVASNSGDGIQLGDEASAADCNANANTGDGIVGAARLSIRNCHTVRNTLAGIHVTGAGNKIDGNNMVENAQGIDVDAGGNLIIRNTASRNPLNTSAANYAITGTNEVGPIGGVAAGTNFTANISY